ncbi:TonB-dependent receptor [Plebeiibacterium sediminum]|uniref:TonB-dependent receptor n=1 Tax=Plebeiibacterium sediminum TaxID=2992112 RepID=A0AAE3M0I9_9BACT|nr:TonB-dependent receptor [Plebeiobacterium sediminum]MCW3784871.1 TonB-dependent receptor [Plebeiobacterium sediminum]
MKNALLSLFIFILIHHSTAQNNSKLVISPIQNSVTFSEFVNNAEHNLNIKFFYKENWVDSLIIMNYPDSTELSTILHDAFMLSKLSYIIDGSNIIITNDNKLQTSLPEDFFTNKPAINIKTKGTEATNSSFINKPEKKEVQISNSITVIGNPKVISSESNCSISGKVLNHEDGQPVVGAQIYIQKLNIGTITDPSGYYVLNVPVGKSELMFKSMGLKDLSLPIHVYSNGSLNVNMEKSDVLINEIKVIAENNNNVKNLNMGVQQINIDKIKQITATLGEVDVLKTALLLPGVQTVGEGSSGFNVRGGSTDQNLILFDDIPIFNSSHLFGFFSVFNPETVKDFKLYKSGIPATYGGRASSVFDVEAKQGNLKKYAISGGISPVTGKLTLEGPIIKDKLSVIIGGRSTYSDWILKQIDSPQTRKSSANFYDISTKILYLLNDKNEISFTGYLSRDNFTLNSDTAYHYQNKCAGLFFKHYFSPTVYSKISGIYSNYQYNITRDDDPELAFNMKYDIDYKSVKSELHYFPNSKHNFIVGSEITRYDMTPGNMTPHSSESDITEFKLPKEQSIETGLFLSNEFKISNRFSAYLGVRLANFFILGPYKDYEYNPLVPKRVESRMDSTQYAKNEIVKTYGEPEIRFSSRYILGVNNSLKFSYNKVHQFVHMISNSSAISPTDVWKISDPTIKPLIGEQFALGYYHNLFTNTIEASAELYYKKTRNHLDYKSGAELLLNPNLDVALLSGIGRAYGLELLLKKEKGKINGWVSYTYSKSELKIDSKFAEDRINDGEYYPTDYDKTHDFTIVANYKHSRRYSISSTFTYSTGRPISMPVAKYNFRNNQLLHYSNRNEYRIPDYLRWDISLNIYENLKSNKTISNFWSIGIYNVTGRHNAYSVYFKSTESRKLNGYLLSVFAKPIINVSYNVRF